MYNLCKKSLLQHVNPNPSARSQRGVIIPLTAIMILALVLFGALAVDVGYLLVARNQIQNAADAAALNGANYLYPLIGSPKKPNWTSAETQATSTIALNKVDNTLLTTTGTVASGYWNVTGSPAGLQGQGITPGSNDLPAVSVTINKTNNSGPIGTFFAKIFGVNTMNVQATAVAVRSYPGTADSNLFPVAIPECMYETFWDSENNQPNAVNDPAFYPTAPNPPNDPYMFGIGSAYHYPGCGASGMAGQWTSFQTDNNDTTTMRDLIDYATGAQTPPESYTGDGLSIGDNIWIQPGTKATLYDNPSQTSVDKCSDNLNNSFDNTGDKTCAYVLVPVICPNSPTCDNLLEATHSSVAITGFACLNIIKAIGGSEKTIIARMVAADAHPECKLSGTGGGPSFGVILPSKLVNYYGNTY